MEISTSHEKILTAMRSTTNNDRLNKRKRAFYDRRNNLQEISKSIEVPTIAQFQELCTKFLKKKELPILHGIWLGLAGGQTYINTFMENPTLLYNLIGCYTVTNNAELQLEAATTLINLSLGTDQQCLEIITKVGAYLVAHMAGGNVDLQDLAAWCLGNLCGSHKDVCIVAQQQGAERMLQRLLLSDNNHVIQSTTYAAFHYYSTLPDNIGITFTSDSFKLLMNGFIRQNSPQDELSLLYFLLSTNQETLQLLSSHDSFYILFEALYMNTNTLVLNVGTVTSLLRCISNCVASNRDLAANLLNSPEKLSQLCTKLLDSSYIHLRKETIQLLANIINHPHTCETEQNLLILKSTLNESLSRCLSNHF